VVDHLRGLGSRVSQERLVELRSKAGETVGIGSGQPQIDHRVGDGSAGPCIGGDRGKTALPIGLQG